MMFKKIFFLVFSFLFLTLETSFAITKEEEAKLTSRDKVRMSAWRGNVFGIFGWDGYEKLNLDNERIFFGCLGSNGIVRMNDALLRALCQWIAEEDGDPMCSDKKMAKFRKLKGMIVFMDTQNNVAPYFRPLTDEEARELYGNRVPVCYNFELGY